MPDKQPAKRYETAPAEPLPQALGHHIHRHVSFLNATNGQYRALTWLAKCVAVTLDQPVIRVKVLNLLFIS